MNSAQVKIAPSILAADFARLGDQVAQAQDAGADRIHVDVMDGHFVPNISIGPLIVQSLRPITSLPLETHLMIEYPDQYIHEFVQAGSDSIEVHVEGNPHVHRTVHLVKSLGKKVGIVVNPATPASAIGEILRDVDIVLVMTVNPGFGGQRFISSTLPKIQQIRAMISQVNPDCELEVDGGVDLATGRQAVQAGANVLVAGSSVFRTSQGIAAAVRDLKQCCS